MYVVSAITNVTVVLFRLIIVTRSPNFDRSTDDVCIRRELGRKHDTLIMSCFVDNLLILYMYICIYVYMYDKDKQDKVNPLFTFYMR